jgi:Hemerythrin HHE cation binding domain
MTDAIELLRRDHDEARRLLSELEASPEGTGGPRRRGRQATVARVISCESTHEAIEEQYFWPVVRRRVRDGERLADEAIRQECRLKHVLGLLDGLDAADPDFELLLRQLIATCRAHHDFEESRVWPGARLALSEQELADLGVQLEQGRRFAPTRPHPNLPPDPEVQRLAGRIAGATDRIRDALAGRSGS